MSTPGRGRASSALRLRLGSFTAKRRRSRMSQDVLLGYRLQLFDLAGRIGVAAAQSG
jgi:hypothetical protein